MTVLNSMVTRKGPYRGPAVVSFIDLMGFTAKLRASWGSENSALDKLLSIKSEVTDKQKNNPAVFAIPGLAPATSEVGLFSDSMIIVTPMYSLQGKRHVWSSYIAAATTIATMIGTAAQYGFGVRGGVELGDIYWDGNEAIGPAFIDAYELERPAETARVVLGAKLLTRISEDVPRNSGVHFTTGELTYRCADGCFAVRPWPNTRAALIELRTEAPEHLAYRYDELIANAPDEGFFPKNLTRHSHYLAAAAAAKRLCAR